jgi:D-glycero-alpha-D-manno-heptose 1-phosphate guanylyltransferase
MDRLHAAGCGRVALATGHLSQAIEGHFGTNYRGMPISYSIERTPLGTGGAIVQALYALPLAPTLVLNGDTWLDVDLARFDAWCELRADAGALVLRTVPDVSRYGRVRVDGEKVVAFGEKGSVAPGLINAGIYRLRLGDFERFNLPAAFSVENDFFQPHCGALDLRGFVTEGRFIDIGVPEDYDRAQTELPIWAASAT